MAEFWWYKLHILQTDKAAFIEHLSRAGLAPCLTITNSQAHLYPPWLLMTAYLWKQKGF